MNTWISRVALAAPENPGAEVIVPDSLRLKARTRFHLVFAASRFHGPGQICVKIPVPLKEWSGIPGNLFREAEVLRLLQHCPLVPRLYPETTPRCLIRDWVEGDLLETAALSRGLSLWSRLVILRDVLYVIQQCHDLNPPRLLRDIKPRNTVVSRRPGLRGVIIDFGGSQILGIDGREGPVREGKLGCGEYLHQAPEVLLRDYATMNCSADLFAFGVLAHWLLTGIRPYTNTQPDPGEIRAAFRAEESIAWHRLKKLPNRSAAEWLINLTRVDPSRRFQRAVEVLDHLNDLIAEAGESVEPFNKIKV